MKTFCRGLLGISVLFLTVVLTTSALVQASGKKVLRLNGAGMASDQVDFWAKRFMEANQDILVTVIGSSAGKGFQSLLNGNAEIAMMSREVTRDEREKATAKGLKLVEKPVGRAAIALITHPRNPVNELTLEQIRKLFTGEYENWKQVGGPDAPVRCLARKIPESGGSVFFWNKVLNGEAFGSKTVMTETWDAILKVCTVGEDIPIGIIPSTRNFSKVKVLSIKEDEKSKSVAPKDQTVKDASYPLVLTFSFVWDEATNDPVVKKFADFCLDQGGGDGSSGRSN